MSPKLKSKRRSGSQKPVKTKQVVTRRSLRTQLKTHFLAFVLLFIGGSISVTSILALLFALQSIGVTETLRLNGRLQAIEQSTPIRHETGGVVKNVFVTEGEVVREGQILMSLGTEDLEKEHEAARKKLVGLLLQSHCLRALHDGIEKIDLPEKLKRAAARLNVSVSMKRGVRHCQSELERHALKTAQDVSYLASLRDQADLQKRLADTKRDLRLSMANAQDRISTNINSITYLSNNSEVLKHSLAAAVAQQAYEKELRGQKQTELDRKAKIMRRLDLSNDKLIDAEADLARMEKLMKKRFVFASTSGRIQRLRISEPGKNLAANAYVLEIAPLKTDFELLSTVNVLEIPDLRVGSEVQVKLSGALPKPIWVPAKVVSITKATANKRLIRITLTKEDLNQRDLLIGDNRLNGLGEQSEAMISVTPESALGALSTILQRRWAQTFTQGV